MTKLFSLSTTVLTLSLASAFAGPPSFPIDESTPAQGRGGASVQVDENGDGEANAGNDVGGLTVEIDDGEVVSADAGKK